MNNFKLYIDACIEFAENLRIHYEGKFELKINEIQNNSIEDNEDLIKWIYNKKTNEDFVSSYIEIRKIVTEATSLRNFESQYKYQNAISEINELIKQIVKKISAEIRSSDSFLEFTPINFINLNKNDGLKILYYYCQAMKGFCYFSLGNLREAINVYNYLEEFFPNHPFINIRLGQIYLHHGEVPVANMYIDKAKKTLDEYNEAGKVGNSDERWPDAIPKYDFNNMEYQVSKTYLNIAQKKLLKENFSKELAYDVYVYAKEAMQFKKVLRGENENHEGNSLHGDADSFYLNRSMICGGLKFMELTSSDDEKDERKNEIEKEINKVTTQIASNIDWDQALSLDDIKILFITYAHLRENEKAKKAAERIKKSQDSKMKHESQKYIESTDNLPNILLLLYP